MKRGDSRAQPFLRGAYYWGAILEKATAQHFDLRQFITGWFCSLAWEVVYAFFLLQYLLMQDAVLIRQYGKITPSLERISFQKLSKGVVPVLQKIRARMVRQGPSLLSLPVKFTPFTLQRQVLQQVLSWQFRQALAEGELDFLEDRYLKIDVSDIGLRWLMTVEDSKLIISEQGEADVSFSANANDLVLIAARKQDPDTLFFQRRLRIEGDTELGLYVKNLMDAIDLDSMPLLLKSGLMRLADFIEAGLQEDREPGAPVVQTC